MIGLLSSAIGWALKKLPFLGAWWMKYVLYAVAAGTIFFGGYHTRSVLDDAARAKEADARYVQLQKDMKDQHELDVAQHDKDEATLKKSAEERDTLRQKYADLQQSVSNMHLVNHSTEVVKDDKGQHTCNDTTRSDSFRLCYNAAQTGDAAAIAACKASRLPDPVPSQ